MALKELCDIVAHLFLRNREYGSPQFADVRVGVFLPMHPRRSRILHRCSTAYRHAHDQAGWHSWPVVEV